jgi:hypothetical protein
MRYSELLKEYYRIGMDERLSDLVDIYYSGAATHFHKWRSVLGRNKQVADFHLTHHKAHLRHLMALIFNKADFSRSVDPDSLILNERESWNPDGNLTVDPGMFDDVGPDPRHVTGENHPLDSYLADMRGPTAPQGCGCKLKVCANS